jgi:hypothetical protein
MLSLGIYSLLMSLSMTKRSEFINLRTRLLPVLSSMKTTQVQTTLVQTLQQHKTAFLSLISSECT